MSNFKIFISHASEDSSLANHFKNYLESKYQSLDVFVSGKNLVGGSVPYTELQNLLTECRIIITLLTKKSIENKWVNFESGAGILTNKTVPVIFDTSKEDFERSPFKMIQYRQSDRAGIEKLFDDISRLNEIRVPKLDDLDKFISGIESHFKSNETANQLLGIVTELAIEKGSNINNSDLKERFAKATDAFRIKITNALKNNPQFEELSGRVPVSAMSLLILCGLANRLEIKMPLGMSIFYKSARNLKIKNKEEPIIIAAAEKTIERFENAVNQF